MSWPIVSLILGLSTLFLFFTFAVFKARLDAENEQRELQIRHDFVQNIIRAGIAPSPAKEPPAKESVQ